MKVIGLELISKLSSVMKIGISQPSLIKILATSLSFHREVEKLFIDKLEQCDSGRESETPFKDLKAVRYFEKNFFSILFLSIFKSLKIPYKRILQYGVILYSLRIIITCTDNMLDSEKKGPIFLNAGLDNPVLNNTMLTLLSYRVMGQAIRELSLNDSQADQIERNILDSICSIGRGEARTKLNGDMPCPDDIVKKIHEKIGGELLRLALIAPLEAETDLKQSLNCMESGILYIGNALQMLDDMTDIQEDILNNKINYFAGWIMHHQEDGTCSSAELKQLAGSKDISFSFRFPSSAASVINKAIETALEGFQKLSLGGYPVNREQATEILKLMFELRGLTAEWKLSKCA